MGAYTCGTKYAPCNTDWDFIDDGAMSNYEKLCYIKTLLENALSEISGIQAQIDLKEDSENITSNRKLSNDGDFTGTIANYAKSVFDVVNELDDNADKIQYIASQFSDGQTGFVIDGGFFEETGIKDNYNGGYF